MASRTLPNLALEGFFDLGEDGWDGEMSLNLLKLSVLVQGRVLSKVAAEPGSPTNGDVHILDETHGTHPNEIAIRDDGAWVYVEPFEGWLLYNEGEGYYEKFDGTIWAELAVGGVSSGVDFPGAPVVGDRRFRIDRGIEYYWDGAQWLSTQIFKHDAYEAEGNSSSILALGRHPVPFKSQGYDIYLVDFYAVLLLSATPASWSTSLQWVDAANAVTTIETLTITTPTDAGVDNWAYFGAPIGAVLDATALELNYDIIELSGAAGLYGGAGYSYRLVG